MSFSKIISSVFAALLFQSTGTLGLPPGFVEQIVFDHRGGLVETSPVVMDNSYFLFSATKSGRVHVLEEDRNRPGTFSRKTAVHLSDRICTNGEGGLGAITAHPNISENRWVYMYYTHVGPSGECVLDPVNGPHNRLSRFTLRRDKTIDLNSELELLRTAPLKSRLHHGGDIAFGNDGYLYLTIGDNDRRNENISQKLDNFFGKVLRITENGDIPPNNPFLDTSVSAPCAKTGVAPSGKSQCQEIFVYGFRNPFRFDMDPNTPGNSVRFLVGDVGGRAWEEVSEVGHDTAGKNFGFPTQEGPCRFASTTDCPVFQRFEEPIYWYDHPPLNGPLGGGAAVTAVAVPKNGIWPSEYDDTFFHVEFVEGKVYHVKPDSSVACRSCTPPRSGTSRSAFYDFPFVTTMHFGPYYDSNGVMRDGALYVVSRQSNPSIRRIVYVGGNNRPPNAMVIRSPQGNVEVGQRVTFDARSSTDADMDTLSFDWSFGDGAVISDGSARVQHAYSKEGTYEVVVTAKDTLSSDEAQLTVGVGTPPKAIILQPAEGTQFAVGDVFTIRGRGEDSEGNQLPASSMSIEVRQHHNMHFHPFLSPTTGISSIVLDPAPGPEDFDASTNSYLEVRLTITDQNGLMTTASRKIMPKSTHLSFETEPNGLKLQIERELLTMPQTLLSWENHQLMLIAPDQGEYKFERWSQGGPRKQNLQVPANTTNARSRLYTAFFVRQGDPTQSPTKNPTSRPTVAPTTSPTRGPTKAPIQSGSEPACARLTFDGVNRASDWSVFLSGKLEQENNPDAIRWSPTSENHRYRSGVQYDRANEPENRSCLKAGSAWDIRANVKLIKTGTADVGVFCDVTSDSFRIGCPAVFVRIRDSAGKLTTSVLRGYSDPWNRNGFNQLSARLHIPTGGNWDVGMPRLFRVIVNHALFGSDLVVRDFEIVPVNEIPEPTMAPIRVEVPEPTKAPVVPPTDRCAVMEFRGTANSVNWVPFVSGEISQDDRAIRWSPTDATHRFNSGPEYGPASDLMNRQCLTAGSVWEIRAKVKLVEKGTNKGAWCDTRSTRVKVSCPAVLLFLRDVDGQFSSITLRNYQGSWERDQFNQISVRHNIPTGAEWTGGVPKKLRITFNQFPNNLDLIVKDFEMVRI